MALSPALRTKVDEWSRIVRARIQLDLATSEHSRWVFIGAAMVAWLLLTVYLGVHVTAAHRQHRELQADVARLDKLVGDTSWKSRRQQSEALKFQLNQRLWTAATAGLAEAGFERWIREHVAKQGLDVPQVQITLAPATIQEGSNVRTLPGLQRMIAKVTTSYNAAALATLTADMIESDKVILLDQLIVRTQRNSRLEMNVSTFVRLTEGDAGAKP